MHSRGKQQSVVDESDSDWDDDPSLSTHRTITKAHKDTAPKIELSSGDEKPVRDVTVAVPETKRTARDSAQSSKHNKGKQENKDHKMNETISKTGSKTAKKSSKRSSGVDGFTFTDQGGHSDFEDHDIVPSSHRSPQRDNDPPYDFRSALQPNNPSPIQTDKGSTPQPARRNVNSQKYEPHQSKRHQNDNIGGSDWDDTDEENETMKEIRENFRKHTSGVSEAKKHANDHDSVAASPSDLTTNQGDVMKGGHDTPEKHLQIKKGSKRTLKSKTRQEEQEIKTPRKALFNLGEPNQDEEGYIYYFEAGHVEYCQAHPDQVLSTMPQLADRMDPIIRRAWMEFFGLLRIVMIFASTFIVELVKFITRDIFYSIVVGVLVALADFVFKPLLSTTFNGFIQPTFILTWNIITGFRHLLTPAFNILTSIMMPFVTLLNAFRLVEVNTHNKPSEAHVV